MKTKYLLAVMFFCFPFQGFAVSFGQVEAQNQQYGIDPERFGILMEKPYADWGAFTTQDKVLAVKGTIINLGLATADSAVELERHTHAAIGCLDTKSHGLKLSDSEDLSLPLVRCVTGTVKQLPNYSSR